MRCVLATSNPGKVAEFQSLLDADVIELVPQSYFGLGTPAETGSSFAENALLKARYASMATGLPALGDDSGLGVEALGGAPGIFSARYSVEGLDSSNNSKLLHALREVAPTSRQARFVCVLAFVRYPGDLNPLIASGHWSGAVAESCSGSSGFGYDPVFLVPALGITAGQLPSSLKQRLGHRSMALRRLRYLLNELKPG